MHNVIASTFLWIRLKKQGPKPKISKLGKISDRPLQILAMRFECSSRAVVLSASANPAS